MVMFDYFEAVLEGVEFLIALGSLVGLLGFIIGLIFVLWGSSRRRYKMMGLTLVSLALLVVCGFSTGLKYFRIFR
ncbi:MAG: hypothetical protein EAX91_01705 [Candidatus Lokiarchaeota archaeon]|nr:hypothetical protein [Candidatus Lokiarchaeota archaeon]